MKFKSYIQLIALVCPFFISEIAIAQPPALVEKQLYNPGTLALNTGSYSLPGYTTRNTTKDEMFYKPYNAFTTGPTANVADDDEFDENQNIPHTLSTASSICFPGTINRFTGSWHSNLYIGNTSGTNVLLAWGQNMSLYTTGAGANYTSPATVSAASYGGVPLEVRSSSSGGATGLSVMVLRTTTKLYVFGTAANITAITTMAGFGGASLITAASDVTAKLPAGVTIAQVAQVAISQTAFAIVTITGDVYVLTTVLNLQGDKTAVVNSTIWHHVKLADGVTFLTGVNKISVSSSGIFASTTINKLYYWGSPANVAGVVNTTTSYNYAFDMSAQIPATKTIADVVVLGTNTPSPGTLFILCTDKKVYGCGLNTNGVLGINNTTVTFNQPVFITVKGTDGLTDLVNIAKIDGDTEGDIFCMGALSLTGQVYGWGDSPAGMLGVNPAIGSFAVPKTVQLFSPTPGVNFTDFSIAGHFTIAFYVNGPTDQYWYLGHNIGGSVGDPANVTTFILAGAPASLNSSGGVTFDCSNVVLPITWLSFNAKKQQTNVLLTWSTASEQNNRDFLVEHSTNETTWQTISIVPGAGNSSSEKNYSFIHTNPAKNINYYRILQQDMDGRSSYSKTISIFFSTYLKQLSIYPAVITDGKLYLQLQQAATVNLYNYAGQLELSKELPAGSHILNTSKFAKGLYFLQAGTQTEKFMIQ